MEQIRRWWQNRNYRFIAFAAGALVVLIIVGYWVEGTGFGGYTTTSTATKTTSQESEVTITEQYQRGKTLWDWMGLLIVPIVLATGAFLFNRSERRNEQYIADQRTQDATLQTYLDQMTELLIDKKLRESQPGSEVRDVARVRTLTALRRLDSNRQNILLRFLHDGKLIGLEPDSIIDFRRINLSNADLRETVIGLVNLEGADLRKTDLTRTTLTTIGNPPHTFWASRLGSPGANLTRADLREANLTGANLIKANQPHKGQPYRG